MGISIVLKSESQEVLAQIDDAKNVLHALLPPQGSPSMLGSVDWYGDTIFNRLQMSQFLSEWESVETKASGQEEASLLRQVRTLALRCKDEPHLYLAFIGD
jgi:hypothetical protein